MVTALAVRPLAPLVTRTDGSHMTSAGEYVFWRRPGSTRVMDSSRPGSTAFLSPATNSIRVGTIESKPTSRYVKPRTLSRRLGLATPSDHIANLTRSFG